MSGATIADWPVELVEKIADYLDVKDVLELMMVNKRLYAIYARDQSIVFGKHVAEVALGQDWTWIKKFVDSPSLRPNTTILPFIKRIDSCDDLECSNAQRPDGVFLGQLKFVNQLELRVTTREDCLKFLTYFRGSVKKSATLDLSVFSFEQDQVTEEQTGKFIENQLNECEKIILDCEMRDCSRVYLEAMMKTQVKTIAIRIWQWNFDPLVAWIVDQGIPSKNSAAVIHIGTPKRFSGIDFLSPVQGLQRVDDDENHSKLVSCANELLGKNRVFDENSLCFRHEIDPTTTRIYVFHKFGLEFSAFYMPSQ